MSSGMYSEDITSLASSKCTGESLPHPDRCASADNPFCGDRVDLQVNLEAGRVTALAQNVRACVLCQASANVLAKAAVGLSKEELERVSANLTAMLNSGDYSSWPPGAWESLALFEPVARHKSRHGCVTLPLKALLKALS